MNALIFLEIRRLQYSAVEFSSFALIIWKEFERPDNKTPKALEAETVPLFFRTPRRAASCLELLVNFWVAEGVACERPTVFLSQTGLVLFPSGQVVPFGCRLRFFEVGVFVEFILENGLDVPAVKFITFL